MYSIGRKHETRSNRKDVGVLRGSGVAVVESAEMRNRDDFARTGVDGSRQRRVSIERQVRARLVVVGGVAAQHLGQVPFSEWNSGDPSRACA